MVSMELSTIADTSSWYLGSSGLSHEAALATVALENGTWREGNMCAHEADIMLWVAPQPGVEHKPGLSKLRQIAWLHVLLT